ncbi:MAG: DNA-directed RNA polymerase subunit D [Candidatus Diapherotrites archaeon CG10_big_fil_rev_8_21_14_0_10_31_34]|nr:MAG: DNA-directed RNA polymerase subunit D [Candidatus Diapherotrites archaeon CG10_big_fil_rev_8_21_14_0_10_31_34]PJA16648.1 MAG: DNA-directed RNA polymerase subunit D [Candidatus Diapherotrites archaeon CG_4_10_14_0_2_um_filter_31_5]
MEIKQIKKGDRKIKFQLKGTNPAFVNGIRRAIQTNVKSFAVDSINIYENTSVMFNEMLSHRMGMLPIQGDPKTYKTKDKVTLMIEKEGPCTVYSKDVRSTDPKIEVVDKKIPILKLGKGQKLKAEMDAVVDSGKTHTKWISGVLSYNYDKDLFTINLESFGGMEPKEILIQAAQEIKEKTEGLRKALSTK